MWERLSAAISAIAVQDHIAAKSRSHDFEPVPNPCPQSEITTLYHLTSNPCHRSAVICNPTSDLCHLSSVLRLLTSDLRPLISILRLLTSVLSLLTSVLSPLTSVL